MLKLVQNMFGDMGTLQVDEKGVTQPISWKYIDALNDVQEKLGLSMANKLTKKHLLWVKNKMKVKLAAQTLSTSVATAIDFLREEAKIPEFQGSAPTTKFIKVVDCAFDCSTVKVHLQKALRPLSNCQICRTGLRSAKRLWTTSCP